MVPARVVRRRVLVDLPRGLGGRGDGGPACPERGRGRLRPGVSYVVHARTRRVPGTARPRGGGEEALLDHSAALRTVDGAYRVAVVDLGALLGPLAADVGAVVARLVLVEEGRVVGADRGRLRQFRRGRRARRRLRGGDRHGQFGRRRGSGDHGLGVGNRAARPVALLALVDHVAANRTVGHADLLPVVGLGALLRRVSGEVRAVLPRPALVEEVGIVLTDREPLLPSGEVLGVITFVVFGGIIGYVLHDGRLGPVLVAFHRLDNLVRLHCLVVEHLLGR